MVAWVLLSQFRRHVPGCSSIKLFSLCMSLVVAMSDDGDSPYCV